MSTMQAMRLTQQGQALQLQTVERPDPGPGQVLIKVLACAVCRTDLHVCDGDLAEPKLPLVPGHEVVGLVAELGSGVETLRLGQRVGVPWLGWTCGQCHSCQSGQENLCPQAKFTGYTLDGGFAQWCVADERYCFLLPDAFPDLQAAPLLCAGLIGYRSYRMVGAASTLGFYGFGAAAHILIQAAVHQGRVVYAFTRPGDVAAQSFARELGAAWAGGSDEPAPEPLDAAIIFAPVGSLVPAALQAVRPGGLVVCAGIHMSDIPSFAYSLLWQERRLRSVANLTRRDGEEFLELAPKVPLKVKSVAYPLEQANQALDDLRNGRLEGAAVLIP